MSHTQKPEPSKGAALQKMEWLDLVADASLVRSHDITRNIPENIRDSFAIFSNGVALCTRGLREDMSFRIAIDKLRKGVYAVHYIVELHPEVFAAFVAGIENGQACGMGGGQVLNVELEALRSEVSTLRGQEEQYKKVITEARERLERAAIDTRNWKERAEAAERSLVNLALQVAGGKREGATR